jgi:Protein of unknown function (DUF3108)
VRLLLLIVIPVLLLTACSEDSGELVARDIVSAVPWEASETTSYRLLQGDDVKGTGELSVFEDVDGTRMTQSFSIPDEEITDVIAAQVSLETLRPQVVERIIDGPEGKRECTAQYSSSANSVTVDQRAGEDERTDELDIPPQHYDSWSDLFLWRTIEFFEGNEVKYVDVLSCSLAKPDLLSVVLKVKEIEELTVPAGTFRAWRLEIRSGGRTQKAWYADDDRRTLVRYDNGDLVFELESIS